jgi:glycosyltransferase involved in cell wall biosynthesis
MRIIINTASTFKGGGVQVARSFIEECKKYTGHQYYVILGEMLADLVDEKQFPKNFTFYKIGYRPATKVFSFGTQSKYFKDLEKEISPDVVFTTSGPAYWRPNAPHLVGYNLPHYIYTDSPFFSLIPLTKRLKWNLKGSVIKYFFKRDADAYVVQTDDVNERLRKILSVQKVYTVSNTVSHFYKNISIADNKLPVKKDGEFRFLTLSAWYKHKNMEVIPAVVDTMPDALKERVRFVLTLPEDVFQKQIPAKYHKYILNVGPVKPDEGPSLYKECDALFLPTLLECFSASYVEAMAMEKPIITSDMGFARSVCREAALYVNPMNSNNIAETVKELVENPTLQKTLQESGKKRLLTFATAEKRAAEYLNICEELADARKN